MSLFNQILNAINNPEQEGSTGQLSNIFGTIEQLSNNYQTSPSAIQSALSIIGNYTRSSLKEKRNTEGEQQVQQIINQFGGTQPSPQVVNMLFNMPQLEQMLQQVESKTGINSRTIQSMLPVLVPLILNFLKTGNNAQNPQASNSVANSFLDADGDGDVDIADAMGMAMQYLR
ncbi:conserved hypothetical protein [Gloeothece citriformis PCC 7424]|uniref:DUF937 domain-containing protein n=1 Tax=Gloeothece citriformis (strain PCC 7424) TaxID=65393 RepID=B7KDI2_GLOC7|nr:DUF937 domain-containing protein [Gloeothece citriformis]ACK69002.1 conserved hypothetical protein [Gloeothece citriformis PCC 7424]